MKNNKGYYLITECDNFSIETTFGSINKEFTVNLSELLKFIDRYSKTKAFSVNEIGPEVLNIKNDVGFGKEKNKITCLGTKEGTIKEIKLILENLLDTFVEVDNGVTNKHLHKVADDLFKLGDKLLLIILKGE